MPNCCGCCSCIFPPSFLSSLPLSFSFSFLFSFCPISFNTSNSSTSIHKFDDPSSYDYDQHKHIQQHNEQNSDGGNQQKQGLLQQQFTQMDSNLLNDDVTVYIDDR